MKTTTATVEYMKNHLGVLLKGVRRGKTVLIVDRHVPVAKLGPVDYSSLDNEEYLASLESDGVLRRAKKPLKKSFLKAALPKTKNGASIVDALLVDREEKNEISG